MPGFDKPAHLAAKGEPGASRTRKPRRAIMDDPEPWPAIPYPAAAFRGARPLYVLKLTLGTSANAEA